MLWLIDSRPQLSRWLIDGTGGLHLYPIPRFVRRVSMLLRGRKIWWFQAKPKPNGLDPLSPTATPWGPQEKTRTGKLDCPVRFSGFFHRNSRDDGFSCLQCTTNLFLYLSGKLHLAATYLALLNLFSATRTKRGIRQFQSPRLDRL